MLSHALFAVCCLALVAQSHAGLSFGNCPTDKGAILDFKPSEYVGHWYQSEATSQVWQYAGKCPVASYTLDPDTGRVLVDNSFKSIIGELSQKGYAVLDGKPGEAKLNVVFEVPLFGHREASYHVLDTDYVNFAVVYSCTGLGPFKAEFGYILSRKPTLDAQYSDKVDAAVQKAGFRRLAFQKNVQDC